MAVQRLSKVARELNVGISTIVDFLEEKGVSIDAKPNTKLDPEVYDMVSEEFQSDKGAKEESQNVTMPSTDRDKVSIETAPDPVANDADDDESILIKNIPAEAIEVEEQKETVVEEETPAPVEEETVAVEEKKDEDNSVKISPIADSDETVEDGKVKVLGTIDLSSMNLKTRPDKKSKKAQEEEEAKAAKKAKEVETAKIAKAKSKADAKTKAEQEAKKKSDDEAAEKAAVAKAKEDAKPQEIKTDVAKLEGIKVLGKIELPKEKKPVASSAQDKETQRPKRKRKRIAPANTSAKPTRGGGGSRRGAPVKKAADVELTDKQIQDQIKETLARLTGGGGKSKGGRSRKRSKEDRRR